MLVMVRVPLAFLATRAARLEARLDDSARQCGHELCLPAQNLSRSGDRRARAQSCAEESGCEAVTASLLNRDD
jgi:hypothetical protein